MEGHHQILPSDVIARPDHDLAIACDRSQLEFRCPVPNFQRHRYDPQKIVQEILVALRCPCLSCNFLFTKSDAMMMEVLEHEEA